MPEIFGENDSAKLIMIEDHKGFLVERPANDSRMGVIFQNIIQLFDEGRYLLMLSR